MAKQKTDKKKSKAVNQAKAKLRGVISAARSATTYSISGAHSYDAAKKKSYFSQSLSTNLLLARQELQFNDYSEFLEWADKQQDHLLPKSFKQVKPTLSSLSYTRETKEISLLAEAYWLSYRLHRERETITAFLKKRNLVESAFWQGNVDLIYTLLTDMEESLGHSIWLVETRLSIEQFFKGLESQKKILEEIRNKAGRGFVRFLSHRISMRNEPAVTTQRFSSNLNAYIGSKPNLKKETAEYLRYKLCHETPVSESEICAVLRFQQNHSTIDCYEGLVNIVQELIGLDGKEHLIRPLLGALLRIGAEDFRVTKLATIISDHDTNEEQLSNIEAAGQLLQGNAKKATIHALRSFDRETTKDIFQLYVAAQSSSFRPEPIQSIKEGKRAPQIDLTRLLSNIIAKNSQSAISFDFLEKTLRNFHIFPSCKAFLDIVRREHDPLLYRTEKAKLYFLLNNPTFSPLDTPANSKIESILYGKNTSIEKAVKSFSNIRRSDEGLVPLPQIAGSIARIAGTFQRGEKELTLDAIATLKNNDHYPLVESRLKPIEVDTLISIGDIRRSIRILGSVVANNKSYVGTLPFQALINSKSKWPDLRQYSDEISLPIILHHIYKSNPTDALASLRRTAVDTFIRSNALERPSDLLDHMDKFGKENIVYFFKNLCISSILDMCKCLDGTKAVDEERLKVLGALIELDHNNSALYEDEILTLSSSLRIREGLKVVDGSRIHVDLEGILRWAHAELQESLSRYKNLVAAGVGVADDLDDVLKDFLNQSSPKAYLDVPESEADDIVISMLWDLRERFLFDKPHGLNSYLSKRVRHNSIAGYLRGALDKDSLITATSGGIYRDNIYWRNILKDHNYTQQEIETKLRILEDFGSKFDNLTSHLKNSALHIKRPEFPNGLIDLPLTPALVHVARSSLQSSSYNLDSWFDVCIAMFWLRLEPSLFRVRESLSKEYKSKFIALFDNLRADLVKATGRERQCYELTSAINNASIDLQNLIDRAADWFNKRQGELSKYIYSLNEIIDISIQSALTRHRSCKLDIEKESFQTMGLRADSLVLIADIFLIVIGNISEHSGCREKAKLKVSAEMDDSRNIINFRFESLTNPEEYTKKNLELIKSTKAEIDSGAYLDKIALEGRSGLFKVASIVRPDAGGRIDFGFQSPTCFFLDIDLIHTVENVDLEPYITELDDETVAC